MKKIFIGLLVLLILAGCSQKHENKLIIGIISPSLNHLPLDFGLEIGALKKSDLKIKQFASGWETNEALVAGKIDLAILPFTYVWTDVSRGKDVKIISFLERESDGIIAFKEIDTVEKLDGKKIGVLRASTLDIFAEMLFDEKDINPELVYFRTPIDMASALNSGEVDALSFYVPSIFKFNERFEIIHWYGESHPLHPCCDIAATKYALDNKLEKIKSFLTGLQKSVDILNDNPYTAYDAAETFFKISRIASKNSVYHTKYIMSLEEKGKLFEQKAIEKMKEKKYIDSIPNPEDIYFEIN